ncbi:MAG: hypothetical protein VX777_03895 [Chlamydiota bacterium]|nr:hypothetical protein [Chlamydiota bacterium]
MVSSMNTTSRITKEKDFFTFDPTVIDKNNLGEELIKQFNETKIWGPAIERKYTMYQSRQGSNEFKVHIQAIEIIVKMGLDFLLIGSGIRIAKAVVTITPESSTAKKLFTKKLKELKAEDFEKKNIPAFDEIIINDSLV